MTKGYLEFFLSNAKFRRLWAASVVSLLGEWFNTIALFFLILEYSGSEFLLGILFSVRMALFAITQPINGLLADRISRKKLMLWANIFSIDILTCRWKGGYVVANICFRFNDAAAWSLCYSRKSCATKHS